MPKREGIMWRSGKQRNALLLLSSDDETTRLLANALAEVADLTTAWTVEDFFQLLKSCEYDLALCDWDCRGADWRQVCRQVQRDYPTLPIIAVSRCGGEQEWVEALKEGCFDLITAPYANRYVLSVIEHAVASREAQAERNVA
jgi:DNA-binding NtrC family response regulator